MSIYKIVSQKKANAEAKLQSIGRNVRKNAGVLARSLKTATAFGPFGTDKAVLGKFFNASKSKKN